MKILSKKQWEKINDTVVNLQLDYNDKCEQLALAEAQVKYLQEELGKLKIKQKRERKPRKEKEKSV
jgi:hypothetical protein